MWETLGNALSTAVDKVAPIATQYFQTQSAQDAAYKLAKLEKANTTVVQGTSPVISQKTLLIGGGVLLAVLGVVVVSGRR